MAARSNRDAYHLFGEVVRAALSCVTQTIVIPRYLDPVTKQPTFVLSESPSLLGRNRALQFDMKHSVEVARSDDGRGWVVRTTSYTYWLYDADGIELVSYQWEPEGRGPVKTPHVHIGKALGSGDIPEAARRRFSRLASAHLPTGLIPVTDLLRTAIRDFGVEPLRRVPGDSATIDWDGVDRLFRAADTVLRDSFEGTGEGQLP